MKDRKVTPAKKGGGKNAGEVDDLTRRAIIAAHDAGDDTLRDRLAALMAPLCTGELRDVEPTTGSKPCSRDYARADVLLPLIREHIAAERKADGFLSAYDASMERATKAEAEVQRLRTEYEQLREPDRSDKPDARPEPVDPASVKAEALREAADSVHAVDGPGSVDQVPSWLRERADRIWPDPSKVQAMQDAIRDVVLSTAPHMESEVDEEDIAELAHGLVLRGIEVPNA